MEPFSAAIFDLDGTLLDSMSVWSEVDRIFFERRGLCVPDDYAAAISGLSFPQAAGYTKSRFSLTESAEEIMAEWSGDCRRAYAEDVSLKRGAKLYLRALKRAGIRLAVATALPEYLYRPALEKHEIFDCFDAICSTHDAAESKLNGAVFQKAANALGVPATACIVFEDIYEGIAGARCLGMRAWRVYDETSEHAKEKIDAIADGTIFDFSEAPLPPSARKRCVIFTAFVEGNVNMAYKPHPNDYILCADAGYLHAKAMNIVPDLVIGDFDSMELDAGIRKIEKYPSEKDDTDTMLCVKRALKLGFADIVLVGGLGGRIDHTLGNISTARYADLSGARLTICSETTQLTVTSAGKIVVPRRENAYLSLLSFSESVEGLTIRGTKYDITGKKLHSSFPLGVSNEFLSDHAEITWTSGVLIVITVCKN